ncbi:hypothetical protein A0128_08145 [Leptospira tipperaryensis]|uniref:Tetratricopeptide repeat protein n=2 Tax=Leptospira tipperaryensis TaxID=2564040 RepID=A0A1D7V2C1_9LEPT|nr:hypothetical protein [Leptospira tipperaryensis]AOP35988.1 hypothetical protein A0128_08145 [Leptospira tipperaryensis]
MKNILCLILLSLVFSVSIYPQSIDENSSYQQIKDLIDSNRATEAQSLLDEWIKINPNDVTLQLYQTEVWIKIADQKYKERKFKTAFSIYEKAFSNWPNNPSLRARYMELKDKKLVDHVPSSSIFKTRYSGIGSTASEVGTHSFPFQEMNESLKGIKEEIRLLREKSNEFYLTLALISISILLQCFVLLKPKRKH